MYNVHVILMGLKVSSKQEWKIILQAIFKKFNITTNFLWMINAFLSPFTVKNCSFHWFNSFPAEKAQQKFKKFKMASHRQTDGKQIIKKWQEWKIILQVHAAWMQFSKNPTSPQYSFEWKIVTMNWTSVQPFFECIIKSKEMELARKMSCIFGRWRCVSCQNLFGKAKNEIENVNFEGLKV